MYIKDLDYFLKFTFTLGNENLDFKFEIWILNKINLTIEKKIYFNLLIYNDYMIKFSIMNMKKYYWKEQFFFNDF